jgi:hypothetical protein
MVHTPRLYSYLEGLWREEHGEKYKAQGHAPHYMQSQAWHHFIDDVVGTRQVEFAADIEDDEDKWVLGISEEGAYLFRLESEGQLEAAFLGKLLGGRYRERIDAGDIKLTYIHPRLPGDLVIADRDLAGVRTILRAWAETVTPAAP